MKREYSRFTLKQKIWMVVAAAVLLACAGMTLILAGYRVTNVEVVGNSHYTEQEIKDMVLKGNVFDNSLLLNIKYRNKSIEDIPFVEKMDVEVKNNDTIRIMVYEKKLAGCISYLGNYMYFDREGIVVESSPQITEGVPEITGLRFNHVLLYEQLPVERSEIFQEILELTQLLDKYEIIADKIYFDTNNNVTLYFGDARVLIGSKSHIDEKIMQLSVIVPSIQGKAGVLDMREYETGTTTLTFEPD
ncbi:MAG: FtsQ-type POTRA domain-containing protein [Lachnospiraceae bacterium]|nr:FtsQ-type POTRA domain-containing protein [Lachnospiraceae bacterium]